MRLWSLVVSITLLPLLFTAAAENDGLLHQGDKTLFPIAFYELPSDDAALKAMADSGVNLVHCGSKADLDRAGALGMRGWVSLGLDAGPTDALKAQIEAVKDHPALAAWEGPDEIVWNFTAFSGLYKTMGVYASKEEWQQQTPKAIEYSESKAAEIIPNMRAAAELLRSLDTSGRPLWINEAQKSDLKFVRQYLPFVDITGCDLYPVNARDRKVESLAGTTDRWKQVGRGKPVWMVLQAFSWHELGGDYVEKGIAFPSFAESRFMAYDVIAHGAKGILYWGSHYTKSPEFRTSLYALTAELSVLQPFLAAAPQTTADIQQIEVSPELRGTVAMSVRRAGNDWLIILVNEDTIPHLGVEITGVEDREFFQLYGIEKARAAGGELIVCLLPHEVKVLCTSKEFETKVVTGREYPGQ